MIEENRVKLRKSADDLLQAVKNNPEKSETVITYLDELYNQIQAQLKDSSQSDNKNFLNQMQILTGGGITGEKIRIALRLSGFDPKNSFVANEISRRFGPNIKQAELYNIAQCIADYAKLNIDRDAKRRKSVLLKWFEEHWQNVSPYLDYVVLEDAETSKENQIPSTIRNQIRNETMSMNSHQIDNQQTTEVPFQNQKLMENQSSSPQNYGSQLIQIPIN